MEPVEIASAHFSEGLRAFNDGDLHLAESCFLKALDLVPDRPSILTNLSILYNQQNKVILALEFAQKAIKNDPTEPLSWLQYAAVQIKLCDYHGAISSLALALDKAPELAEAHNSIGVAFKELDRLAEALASYDKAIILKHEFAEAYVNRGNVLMKLDRLKEALASHDKAIELKPDYAEAYGNRGNVLMELNLLHNALADHDKAISLQPNYAEAYGNRGNVLMEFNRLDEALASYDKAISLKPDYVEAYNNRGNVLAELNRVEEALASFGKAISLRPEYALPYCGIGWIHHRLENWKNAELNFDAALSRDSTINSAISGLALMPRGVLSGGKANKLLNMKLSDWKDGAAYYFARSGLLANLGRYDEAFSNLEKANLQRIDDEGLKSVSWMEEFDRLLLEVKSWNPCKPRALRSKNVNNKKLLIILGPSRSGKTTLERTLCDDSSFFRGFEGCRAGHGIKNLKRLAEEISQQPGNRDDHFAALLEILFPAIGFCNNNKYRLYTVTNPYLLYAVPILADISEDVFFVFMRREKLDNAAEIFARDYSDKPAYAYQAATALKYVELYNSIANELAFKLGRRAVEVEFSEFFQTPGNVINGIYEWVGLEPYSQHSDNLLIQNRRSSESPFREQFARSLTNTN